METTLRRASFRLARHAAVLLIALSSAACGTAARRSPADDAGSLMAVATVDELMQAIVIPASDALFDAVVYSNGALEKAPATPEDWSQLRLQALALAEAGTLLKLPERAMGRADWVELSSAMSDEAVGFARAAESKELDGVLQAGSAVYRTCVACHEKYVTD